MRVIVVSTPVFQLGTRGLAGYGGLEQIAWELARGLAAKGHVVSLVAPDGSTCSGCEVIPCGPPGQWNELQGYERWWQRLLEADVVIDHSWSKPSYLLKEEGRLKAPVLGVLHAPVNTMYSTLPNVDRPCFVCISNDQRVHFEALFSRQARTAYNGIDTSFYRPLGVKRSGRFLFLARFSSIKGADLAIQACKQAGVGLDLVGDTSITNEPDYLARCQAMCDGKQIRLVGPCSRSETVWWFSQAHALLHPNKLFREPFGLAPVEAMLCGCPVIAWAHGAMRETVEPGPTGFLVSSMEELIGAIHAARDVLDKDRVHCREWAMQFSMERMIDRYEQLCVEAVETGGW